MTGTEIEIRPTCAKDGHGFMELRPINRLTPEQRWCGTWYDCPVFGCHNSVLLASAELMEIVA